MPESDPLAVVAVVSLGIVSIVAITAIAITGAAIVGGGFIGLPGVFAQIQTTYQRDSNGNITNQTTTVI